MPNVVGIKMHDKKFLEDLERYDPDKLIEMYGFRPDGAAIRATKSPHDNLDATEIWAVIDATHSIKLGEFLPID